MVIKSETLYQFYKMINFLRYLKIMSSIDVMRMELIPSVVNNQLLELLSKTKKRASQQIEEDLDSSEILKDLLS